MLKEIRQDRVRLVEETLTKELYADKSLNKTLTEAMHYSLMAGGKRLRPLMLMAAAEAVGADGTDFLTSACAMEMIHTYSLIHDDLPAMDNDDYRRGKLTNHKVYGEAMAILAGDALLNLAFEVLLRQKGVEDAVKLRVMREIATAAGACGMIGGQAIDLEAEGKTLDMDTMRKLHMGKTGALFRAAVRSGAVLGGANDAQLAALTVYAEQFGLAFQITDDILDVIGNEEQLGKPVGSDERNQKSTYVSLTSLAEAKRLAQEAVEAALKALTIFDGRADFLRKSAQSLLDRQS